MIEVICTVITALNKYMLPAHEPPNGSSFSVNTYQYYNCIFLPVIAVWI